ncbi:MAG: nickel pincer cofactor biosynthesis protein LarB [Chthonomonadales bacterium]
MDADALRSLLEEVRQQRLPVDAAIERLRHLPFEDLGFAKLDHHRALRTGFPEVIYCPGKRLEHILAIVGSLRQRAPHVLATRADGPTAAAIRESYPEAEYREMARIVLIPGLQPAPPSPRVHGTVAVVAAGTADLPVAEEAAVTIEALGSPVERIYDVGVAGLHRLLAQRAKLYEAAVVVVVAGMEGALASVVGGLVSAPVVAVPTSVGYGAHFGGLAPLLTMLNSCATGVAVVNIDNGFGAGAYAHLVNLCRSDPSMDVEHNE